MTKLFFTFFFGITTVCMQAQNVGIGITNPTEKLEVIGNVKVDTIKLVAIKLASNAGNGKVLTSDAAGNATWQATGNTGFGVWGDCATNGNISEYNPVGDEEGAADDYFGRSVSISGNFAIVGAPLVDVGANTNQGSVSIYQHNGNEWLLIQKIIDATGVGADEFGTSVSISGNFAVVGAPNDDVGVNTNEGSASIYQYNGNSWVLLQKIFGAAGDGSGEAVSISGNYIIIGSPSDDIGTNIQQGSARIYQYSGGNWVLMQKITDATGAANDFFGDVVSISGSFVIAGAQNDAVGTNTDQGSASIYQLNGSSWVQLQKITDATGAANDRFGCSASITGSFAIVGARFDDSFNGSINIYRNNGSNWILMQKIVGDSSSALFGGSVVVSGNYVVVGSISEDVGLNYRQGAAHVYKKVGNLWQKVQRVTDPVGQSNSFFGVAVSFDSNTKRFLIGASENINANNKPGKAVFGKIN